jgi:hypothetical protein
MVERFKRLRFLLGWTVGIAPALLGVACTSTLHETYFLSAHDPATQVTNFFRIRVDGNTKLSRSKYSVGLYDRDAVQRLFGETAIRQEFLALQLSAEARSDLEKLAQALQEAKGAVEEARRQRLENAVGTTAALLRLYRVRLSQSPNLQGIWKEALLQAEAAHLLANQSLATDLNAADRSLHEVQLILEAIRVAVDGDVLVRYFDGAGNEMDVSARTLVIFLATDVSRFAKALKDLAASKENTQNLLLTVFGNRIQEAEALKKDKESAVTGQTALEKRLGEISAAVDVPRPRAAGATAAQLTAAQAEDLKALREAILKMATAAAAKSAPFSDAGSIRAFVAGARGNS